MQFCDPRDNNLFYWYVLCDMRDYPFKYPKYKQNFLFICYFVMYLDFKMFLLTSCTVHTLRNYIIVFSQVYIFVALKKKSSGTRINYKQYGVEGTYHNYVGVVLLSCPRSFFVYLGYEV